MQIIYRMRPTTDRSPIKLHRPNGAKGDGRPRGPNWLTAA